MSPIEFYVTWGIAMIGGAFLLWGLVWAPLSVWYWRANNISKAWSYRKRMKRWCDHRLDPADSGFWHRDSPGLAWSMWVELRHGVQERTCGNCGQAQRRSLAYGYVWGPVT